ncbi:MAG: FAD-dependent oxidoreductase, partial [Gammaproteobacteria bacterium]|nr:FAD-dependent oxidoreductase [Gammaproteobacteria bacterium]
MKKIIILSLVVLLIVIFQVFDLGQFLSLDFIKSQQTALQDYHQQNPLLSGLIFFLIYVLVTGLSLPGATVLTLAGGAIFGLVTGLIIISFASTIGATVAFLISRYIFRETVEQKFGNQLKVINQGIEKDGAFYLFALRLVPAFPFFVINLAMGLTHLKTWTFFWVSQVGMLAGTIVYVNAGTQLGQIESLAGILSPGLIFSFVLLAILPFIARKFVNVIKRHQALKSYAQPPSFDTNLVVIGAGSAGLVTAYIAAAVKAKVTLIEKHKMGGDCLNTGCVPSKAIIRSAKFLSHITRSQEFGIKRADADFDFAEVMQRVQEVITKIEPHDSIERYSKLGVDVIEGTARIVSPYEVEVDGRRITTRNIVVATGARPFVPPIEGIDQVEYYTSDNLWQMRDKPQRMVVLGGGPIGTELAQSFNRLGIEVTQVEMAPRIMIREDQEISEMVQNRLVAEGVKVLVGHTAKRIIVKDGENILIADHAGKEEELAFDALLVAVGRSPNTQGFGLEEL